MAKHPPLTLDEVRAMVVAGISVPITAGVMNVDPRTVARAIKDGTIPAIKIGKRVLVLREPLIRLLETGSAQPAA